MRIEDLKKESIKEGMQVVQTTFLEDGYEVRLRLMENKKESYDQAEISKHILDNFKKLDNINYDGFIVVEPQIVNDAYSLMLVPVSMEEMTDFIWTYVEKYGRREERLVDILGNAVCVLEKAIDGIPDEYIDAKTEAKKKFEKFTSMIF